MTGYWVVFALIAVLIPALFVASSIFLFKKFPLTKKDKQQHIKLMVGSGVLAELYDLNFMAIFTENTILQVVFGCLIIIIVLSDVAQSVASSKPHIALEKWLLLINFIICVIESVILIYKIPDAALQTIVTAIASALYGGLITLTGVAWTIRKSDSDKKNDEIAKAKPYFSFLPMLTEPKDVGDLRVCFAEFKEKNKSQWEAYAKIENSNQSVAILKEIYHDGQWDELEMSQTLIPGGDVILSFGYTDCLHVYMRVDDVLGNPYFYKMELLGSPSPFNPFITTAGRKFSTLRGLKEMKLSEIKKELQDKSKNDKQANK